MLHVVDDRDHRDYHGEYIEYQIDVVCIVVILWIKMEEELGLSLCDEGFVVVINLVFLLFP